MRRLNSALQRPAYLERFPVQRANYRQGCRGAATERRLSPGRSATSRSVTCAGWSSAGWTPRTGSACSESIGRPTDRRRYPCGWSSRGPSRTRRSGRSWSRSSSCASAGANEVLLVGRLSRAVGARSFVPELLCATTGNDGGDSFLVGPPETNLALQVSPGIVFGTIRFCAPLPHPPRTAPPGPAISLQGRGAHRRLGRAVPRTTAPLILH
jgi:hypothetical protein